jgi:hypothetical protein
LIVVFVPEHPPHSDPPPSLQALGEILFDNIDEDIISVVGNTPRTSDATYLGLAIVERSELSTTHEIWKSGSKIRAKKIWNGWPATDPDLLQND